jgi:ABC-type sugar transport system substrate-binding protein
MKKIWSKSKPGLVLSFGLVIIAAFSSNGAEALFQKAVKTNSQITVAVEYGALFFPYHSAIKGIVDAHAKKLGIKIISGDSNQKTTTELNNVQTFLVQKPDCLLLMPVDYTSPAAAEAAAAGKVPMVSLDMKAAGPIKTFVGYDQVQGGAVMGKFVVDTYKKLQKKKIKLMYLRGIPGHPADVARDKGFKATLSAAGLDSTKVEIFEQATDFDRAKAEAAATILLQQNPDMDIVAGMNDDIILGATAAAERANIKTGPKGTLHSVGVDGIPEMLQDIADGTIDATAFQNPIPEAKAGLDACVSIAKGRTVKEKVLKFTLVSIKNAATSLAAVGPIYKK